MMDTGKFGNSGGEGDETGAPDVSLSLDLLGEGRFNSLGDLALGLTGMNPFDPQPITKWDTLAEGCNYTPVTLNRTLLAYSYMSQGLVQTVVDQPVDDAMRGGFDLICDELDDDDVERLKRVMGAAMPGRERKTRLDTPAFLSGVDLGTSDIDAVRLAAVWARLFGGGGLIINTDQDPSGELDIDEIDDAAPLQFIPADRWELILALMRVPVPYNYYGIQLNKSRVIKILGKDAPSFIRPRLQGWGMSEIERCIRPINSFIKFETMLFELIDEAKIDVFKIQGFNSSLASANGTERTQKRVALANFLKNYNRALTMDKEDDYAQKQLAFSGFAEIYNELRVNLSSALKIPMNKLFGQSAGGFSSGQDSIENYNAIVESVRLRIRPALEAVATLRCKQVFGFIPDALRVEFRPLRILDGEQEEVVRTNKLNQVLSLRDRDLVDAREAMVELKKRGVYTGESAVREGTREPSPGVGMGEFITKASTTPIIPKEQRWKRDGGGKEGGDEDR